MRQGQNTNGEEIEVSDELRKKVKEYLEDTTKRRTQCLHDTCPKCHGTGRDSITGGMCVHHISCPCPKCTIMC